MGLGGLAVAGGLFAGITHPTTDVPVDPTAPEARDWLIEELSKPEYAAAQPSLFDRLSQEFFDWLGRLFQPGESVPTDWIPVAIVAAVIVAVAVALLVWGVPRLNRRSAAASGLFGDDDTRSADELREASDRSAAAGDWTAAIRDRFRAIARSLTERTVVFVSPGTTAHDFAERAADAFPDARLRLADAARVFDGVRYLDAEGTAVEYRQLAALDDELDARTPARLETVTGESHA